MEKYICNAEEMDQGIVTLVVDVAKAFEKVQFEVILGLDFVFLQRTLRVLL